LVPAAVLGAGRPAVVVNIPVQPGNAPALARGQVIDAWAGSKDCLPQRVLAAAPVQEVRSGDVSALSGGAAALQVVVRVSPVEAEQVLAALSREATIRLVVREGDLPRGPVAAAACVRPAPADRQGGD
jgi:hypothetical protein